MFVNMDVLPRQTLRPHPFQTPSMCDPSLGDTGLGRAKKMNASPLEREKAHGIDFEQRSESADLPHIIRAR